LAHSFGGFSPGLTGSVALGPVAMQSVMVGAHGRAKQLTSWKQRETKDRARG
jgi:hypothetical protein